MKKKLEFIEGFKGFACICVILSHFTGAFCNVLMSGISNEAHTNSNIELAFSKTPLNLFYNGNFAVCVFFIVSGFVLSYNYFKHHDENYLKRGAIKRYFRLILPIVTVNIFMFLLMKFKWTYNVQVASFTKSPDWIASFNTFQPHFLKMLYEAFIGNFFYYSSNYVSPLWTISYEIYGSLLVFAFLSLFGKEKVRYPLYLLFLILFKESYYSQFIVGTMLCDIMVNNFKIFAIYKSKKWLVSLTFILGIYFASYPTIAVIDNTIYQFINFNTVITNHFIGASLMVLAIISSNILQKIFELKPFTFLGKHSFSLYLIHWPIMISLSSYIIVKFIDGPLSYYKLLAIDFIITISVIFVLAILLNKFIDKKGIRLANKIANFTFNNTNKKIVKN